MPTTDKFHSHQNKSSKPSIMWSAPPAITTMHAKFGARNLLTQNLGKLQTISCGKYHDLKEPQKVNTSQTNFHIADSATDISTALDNLAFAATTDRDIVAQLAANNKQLVETNKLLTIQLPKAMDNNSLLLKKLSSTSSIKPATNTSSKTVSYTAATSGGGTVQTIRLCGMEGKLRSQRILLDTQLPSRTQTQQQELAWQAWQPSRQSHTGRQQRRFQERKGMTHWGG
jgi:hypothetical protein